MVFEDETGFTLHPRLGRGWAKKGKAYRIPTTSQHRQRLNLAGWVAPLLGRYGFIRIERGDRTGFMKVLHRLYKRLRGYTIWPYVDGARWHKGEPVDKILKTHKRIHLEYLPSYQPGLNVQERIWRQIRYEATTNRWFENLETIWAVIKKTAHSWSPKKIRRLCNIT